MGTPLTTEAVDRILAYILEQDRLRPLSDIDLIRECMKTEAADEPAVEEMMDRLHPGWLDEL